MTRRDRPALIIAASAAVVAVAAVLVVRPGPANGLIRDLTGSAAPGAPLAGDGGSSDPVGPAARFFLEHYEQPDGQVVRRDQGGDSVSEGQAYAMVVAAARGDRTRFAAAWGWSRNHLLEPDGLLAWRYVGGRVVDSQPAADADLLSAWALDLASRRFGDAGYRREGAALARSVLDHETQAVAGRTVLVAGPWARGPAPVTNPSYLLAPVMRALAGDDQRWAGAASSSDVLLHELMTTGHLPSDWAVVATDGVAHPTTPPGQPGAPVSYGFDAVRLPVVLAASCQSSEQTLAASLWPTLDRQIAQGGPLVGLDLGGSPQSNAATDPVGEVAAAAVATAAGHPAAGRQLLDRDQSGNGRSPTYFGSAWVALGRLLLQSRSLIACP